MTSTYNVFAGIAWGLVMGWVGGYMYQSKPKPEPAPRQFVILASPDRVCFGEAAPNDNLIEALKESMRSPAPPENAPPKVFVPDLKGDNTF